MGTGNLILLVWILLVCLPLHEAADCILYAWFPIHLMLCFLAQRRYDLISAYQTRVFFETEAFVKKDIEAGRRWKWRYDAFNIGRSLRGGERRWWRSVEEVCFEDHDIHTREIVPGKSAWKSFN